MTRETDKEAGTATEPCIRRNPDETERTEGIQLRRVDADRRWHRERVGKRRPGKKEEKGITTPVTPSKAPVGMEMDRGREEVEGGWKRWKREEEEEWVEVEKSLSGLPDLVIEVVEL